MFIEKKRYLYQMRVVINIISNKILIHLKKIKPQIKGRIIFSCNFNRIRIN